MNQKLSPYMRIGLRYLAAYLVAKGLFDPELAKLIVADPELAMLVQTALGAAIAATAEGWYALAQRYGWAK